MRHSRNFNLVKFFRYLVMASGFFLLSSGSAHAESAGGTGSLNSPLPAGVIYPTPVGILYPGFGIAAGVNAATLATGKRVTAAQVTAAPPLQGGDSITYLASIATSTNKLGWSLGYLGANGGGLMTHGLFAGVGFNLAPISFGVGLRDADISGGFTPNVDFGTKIDVGKDFSFGTVVYNLDQELGVNVGFGYGRKKKESIELNFLMPSLGSSDYAVTFAATVYTGIFGTTFRTTYYLGSKTFSHTLGGLIWITQSFNFLVQLTSPRTLSAGITYVF